MPIAIGMSDLKTPQVIRSDTQPGFAPVAAHRAPDETGETKSPRSVGELKQLLGVRDVGDIVVWERPAEQGEASLDVHPDTRDRLRWRPRFVAERSVRKDGGSMRDPTDPSADTEPRLTITRDEADALRAEGAHARRTAVG